MTDLHDHVSAGSESVTVPVTPTEAMWGGLARDIIMWTRFDRPSERSLLKHLTSVGTQIPDWLAAECRDIDHVPPKGSVAAWVYRAMLDARPSTFTVAQSVGMREALEKAAHRLRELGYVDFANDCLAASQPSPAATVETLNEQAREHPRYDNPRDPFASPDRLPPSSSAGSARQVRPELNLLTIGNTATANKSAVREPVAWTNEAQLGFLKDPELVAIPMAMWGKPNGAARIPLYTAEPQAVTYCTPDGPANCEAWAVDKRCPTCPVTRPHGEIEDCDCIGAVIGQHERSCPLASQESR